MRNILRKLHIGNNHYDRLEAERVSPESTPTAASSSSPVEQKPSSMFSGWLSAVAKHGNQGGSSENQVPRPRVENTGAGAGAGAAAAAIAENSDTDADNMLRESFYEEEYQMQLAMALSVSKFESSVDPEALEFEAAKEMSLGLSPKRSSQAEVVAYRYWAYNVLTYEDRVADGFYDVYGVFSDPKISERMPSLIDLQGTPLSDSITCEVILVSRITDPDLVALELKARRLAVACQAEITGPFKSGLVQEIAELVAHHMGGPVISDVEMLAAWRTSSWELKASLQSIVLPLGALRIGLARHRALLFKVLADCSGIPCRLVKGRHYTGVDDGAVNILKGDDGGEYIIDLMGAPGAVIPPDATASYQSDAPTSTVASEGEQIKDVQVSVSPCIVPDLFPLPCSEVDECIKDAKPSESVEGLGTKKYLKKSYRGVNSAPAGESSVSEVKPGDRRHSEPEVYGLRSPAGRSTHARSPSWTEGIGSPAAQELKVQYMMDAAKENPELAQKLQDVLRESGVEAPADLFLDLSLQQMHDEATEERQVAEDAIERREGEDGSLINREVRDDRSMRQNRKGPRIPKAKPRSGLPGRPPLASSRHPLSGAQEAGSDSFQRPNFVEASAERQPVEIMAIASATRPTVTESMVCSEKLPSEPKQHISVASQVSSAVPSSPITTAGESKDSFFEVPAVAVATDTAEAVTASAEAVGEGFVPSEGEEMDSKPHRGFVPAHNSFLPGIAHREAQSSDLSSQPSRQGSVLEDAAEWEVPWEDITLGERIGLGSYGEVYRGEWHGTEIAVKKFLDQDFSGDALDEFRSEVRIMRRLRHPNVVLFMGAVTRPPHLSIVTEYLPRGSLYKLIHRPHNQLDERRRLRMALDVARGMNYLHSSAPVIVHRDLKSPNLLVDKNWVVKVCDFGLSRLKHNTFLSSRSMAGTPEWMAPEVLRNEPSNEKSDVYSFGVILWELATLQQPWSGMNPMQVVGAVGFQHRRLQIPKDMDPSIASIIHDCWLNDPNSRPSFAEILNSLKPLQRPVISAQPEASKQLSGYQLQRKYEQPLLHMFDSPISKVNFGVLPSQVSGPTDVPIGH